MRDKKYEESVTELQRAAGIRPDDPNILQQLGEAYLNVNKTKDVVFRADVGGTYDPFTK